HAGESPKDQSQALWKDIQEQRVEDGLPPDPIIGARDPVLMGRVDKIRECRDDRDPTTKTCQDTCSLKEGICDNAESICRIADDLDGDPWADGKCKSAKASCKEAT